MARFEIHPTHRRQMLVFNLYGVPLQIDNWIKNQVYVPVMEVGSPLPVKRATALENLEKIKDAIYSKEELDETQEKMENLETEAELDEMKKDQSQVILEINTQTSVEDVFAEIEKLFIFPINIGPQQQILYMPMSKTYRSRYLPKNELYLKHFPRSLIGG